MGEEGILGVCYTADGSYFVQVPGVNVVLLQRQFSGGGTEPKDVMGEMGTTDEYFGKGGSG